MPNSPAGCLLKEAGSWLSAPSDAFIVGLKELPADVSGPLIHRHIFFGHCYKGQEGSAGLLGRFVAGKGALLDMEYLSDSGGRRVAAFGFMAGFCGAALGIEAWCQQKLDQKTPLGRINSYESDQLLIAHLQTRLAQVGPLSSLKIIVLGALGRCGSGACALFERCGLPSENITRWDLAETKKGGPFRELLEYDILVNCIYLTEKIPPFLTDALLPLKSRRLCVVVDVSCDTTNPNNPLPFCKVSTTFSRPVERVFAGGEQRPLDVITIDHLPSLLPVESSERFASDLLPTLLELKNLETSDVWQRNIQLYQKFAHPFL
eukprot:Sdes_comp8914_c0_seq1m323